MPRKKPEPVAALCANCGEPFISRRGSKFCPTDRPGKASPCQVAYGNRLAARGKILAPYVLAWLQGRGGGNTPAHPLAGTAMRELTQIGRDMIEEDLAKGRASPLSYLEGLLGDGFLYCDRKRL